MKGMSESIKSTALIMDEYNEISVLLMIHHTNRLLIPGCWLSHYSLCISY